MLRLYLQSNQLVSRNTAARLLLSIRKGANQTAWAGRIVRSPRSCWGSIPASLWASQSKAVHPDRPKHFELPCTCKSCQTCQVASHPQKSCLLSALSFRPYALLLSTSGDFQKVPQFWQHISQTMTNSGQMRDDDDNFTTFTTLLSSQRSLFTTVKERTELLSERSMQSGLP